jgi:beta-lactamase regulating signal transducer with metallopeptidase domain
MNTWNGLVIEWLQPARFAAWLLDAAFMSVLLLLFAGMVCLIWRRGAASARHTVWFLAVAGACCLPMVSRLMPPARQPLWAIEATRGSINELTLTVQLVPGNKAKESSLALAAPAGMEQTAAVSPVPSRSVTTRLQGHWPSYLLWSWLAGFLLVAGALGAGQLSLRSLRAGSLPADEEWQALLRSLRDDLKVRRPVELLQTSEGRMPMTWGSWRPVLLLPDEAEGWSQERRRVVLLHELAHIKRWDCLTQFIARAACSVYWFNPLVWVAVRRMEAERERACDDLVLREGCRASLYAEHLLEIARAFRSVSHAAAIGMARESGLQGRLTAIVDGSRKRKAPGVLVMTLCGLLVLCGFAACAGRSVAHNRSSGNEKHWFDASLSKFFKDKAEHARHLAATNAVPPEVWKYFQAGINKDWATVTNDWAALHRQARPTDGTPADDLISSVFQPILEAYLGYEVFEAGKEKYVNAFGNDIINSIPRGSIYFGGTDPGRGIVTVMSKEHEYGDPFFTITQNALADGTYLDYLRATYGKHLQLLNHEDSMAAFQGYIADAQERLTAGKLKPGEDVKTNGNGGISITGQVVVMQINALLAKMIFDRNPDREFYVEESFPLDWMYHHLTPHGLIMKVNREPLAGLPKAIVEQDEKFWAEYTKPMIGPWLTSDTTVQEVAAFVDKVYVKGDLSGFAGDRQYLEDVSAQKAFSKLRSSIAGVYSWRMQNSPNAEEQQRMSKAADYAFRQAYVLCPTSPEALFRYVNLLMASGRVADARLLAETTLKLQPSDAPIRGLLDNLKLLQPNLN